MTNKLVLYVIIFILNLIILGLFYAKFQNSLLFSMFRSDNNTNKNT